MIRLLIIQENSRHAANREFRECFSLQRAWQKIGQEADVWGLGHDNFSQPPRLASYDAIMNLENYDSVGWLPDLSHVTSYKMLWAIDEHCRGPNYYEHLRRRDNVNVVLHATKDYATIDGDFWFPNCFDDTLIRPLQVPCRADVGFCGNLLNRQRKLDLLRKHFQFVADIRVLGQQMVEAVNSYRIHFNCNLANDVNARSFETIGCGVPLATNFNAQYLELGFVDGENCILYHDDKELVDKLHWWLDRPVALDGLRYKSLKLSQRHSYLARASWLRDFLESVL